MISFPNGKINIGLSVIGKRADGYHDIESIFYPINVKDSLEIIESAFDQSEITFTSSGLDIDGNESNNLCIRAYRLLKKDFPSLPHIKMHLHKAIPMGAGLGGGSADGTAALKILIEKFGISINNEMLLHYALQLGSDCPFFINNTPSLASGRGEILKPIDLNLSAYNIFIINPGIHINTAWAFSQLKIPPTATNLNNIISIPVVEWKELINNDFETPIFNSFHELELIKSSLYKAGAIYASMSGSGSTLYGIFDKSNKPSFNFPATYFCKWN